MSLFSPEYLFDTAELPTIQLDPHWAPQREMVSVIYETARRLSEMSRPNQEVNEAIGRLSGIPDIEILSEPNFNGDAEFRCAEWAFGHILGESWAQQGYIGTTQPGFWEQTVQFLLGQGYRPLAAPQPGCLVAYGDFMPNGEPWLEHFGIYNGNDEAQPYVVSKFGRGPVVAHHRDLVSSIWGRYSFYFRKGPAQIAPN